MTTQPLAPLAPEAERSRPSALETVTPPLAEAPAATISPALERTEPGERNSREAKGERSSRVDLPEHGSPLLESLRGCDVARLDPPSRRLVVIAPHPDDE